MVKLIICCPLAKQFGVGECSNEPLNCNCSCGQPNYIDEQGFVNCKGCGKKVFFQDL